VPVPHPVNDAENYQALVRQLAPGDFVAVVLLGYGVSGDRRVGEVTVLPFRQIDGGAHTAQVVDFLNTSQSSLAQTFSDISFSALTNRGIQHALDQFVRPAFPLPEGPRAIVTWQVSTQRLEETVARANRNGVSFFTRNLVSHQTYPEIYSAQQTLADNTGGVVVEVLPGSGPAMRVVASWLKNGYRLTIPTAVADDCELHMLEVTTHGMTATAPFSRCDAIPDPIKFSRQNGVARGSIVISEARRVRGIGSPAPVSVVRGEYSIGCTQTFTSEPGYIQPGQAVCVRHNANLPGGQSFTDLIIGGVTSRFVSRVAP
jgi:hypothetical protein